MNRRIDEGEEFQDQAYTAWKHFLRDHQKMTRKDNQFSRGNDL